MKTLLLGFSCGTGRPMTWCSAQNAGAHEEACRGRATPQAAWSAGVGVDWTRSTRDPLAADRWEGPTGSCDRESRSRLSVQPDQGLRHGDRAWPLGSHSGPAKSPPRPPSGEFIPFWVQRGAMADSTPPRASAGCHLDFWGFKACRRPAGSALSATVLSGHTTERLPGPVHLLGSRRVTRGPEVALLDHLRNLLVGDGGPQRRLGAGVLCVLSAERQGHPG